MPKKANPRSKGGDKSSKVPTPSDESKAKPKRRRVISSSEDEEDLKPVKKPAKAEPLKSSKDQGKKVNVADSKIQKPATISNSQAASTSKAPEVKSNVKVASSKVKDNPPQKVMSVPAAVIPPRRSSRKRERQVEPEDEDILVPDASQSSSSQMKQPGIKFSQKKKQRIENPVKKVKDPPIVQAPPSPVKIQIDQAASPEIWVDKYRPQTLNKIIGQQFASSNANKLVKWLRNWHFLHGPGAPKAKKSTAFKGGFYQRFNQDPEGKTFKCVLLSGPPGIGKTTTAHLAVKEVGLDYFELNASDKRNKKNLVQLVKDALTSTSIISTNEVADKHVLIMDEVDGVSGNEDRGGIQALISLIKSSKTPIICICNDRYHTKIRSLATHCYDLRFYKPKSDQLRAFIQSICFKEGFNIQLDLMLKLIESTGYDIRQIIHQIQLFKETKEKDLYDPKKDMKLGIFDAAKLVFSKGNHKNMSIDDKMNLFFNDYSLGPLFVQENYLRWFPSKAGDDQKRHLGLLAQAAEAIADGDIVENMIRRTNNWSLLPMQAAFSSFMPGEFMEGDTSTGTEFPAWLGKQSTMGKRGRLLQSLQTHMHLHTSGSLQALNLDYLPYMRRRILEPLTKGDCEEAGDFLNDYTLIREDLDSINELTLWTTGVKDLMGLVNRNDKAAFTRAFNKNQPQLPYAIGGASKGKKGGGFEMDELGEEGEEGAVVVEEDEEEEEEQDDIKIIKKDPSIKAKKPGGGGGNVKIAPRGSKRTAKGKKAIEEDEETEESDISFVGDDSDSDYEAKKPKPSTSKKGAGKGGRGSRGGRK